MAGVRSGHGRSAADFAAIEISSPTNALVRRLIDRIRDAGPDGSPMIFLEGPNLVQMALSSERVRISHLFVGAEAFDRPEYRRLALAVHRSGGEVVRASSAVISRLSSTRTPQEILAAAEWTPWTLEDLRINRSGFVVVADAVQDPGNVGTLIRTADAAGADGVLLLPGSASPLSAKVLRSTAGSLFHIPVVQVSWDEARDRLRRQRVKVIGTSGSASQTIFDARWPLPAALVFGSEGRGLSAEVAGACDLLVSVPIAGGAESLNVTAAAAVCTYELVRRRMEKQGRH